MSGSAPGPGLRADAIVVAAGAGRRMNGTDKLLAPIAGRPLLAWSLAGVAAAPEIERIVLVVTAENVAPVLASDWLPRAVVDVVAGGARRQESVAAGFRSLEAIDAAGGPASAGGDQGRVVVVHDGARPLVSPALVSTVVHAASEYGAAIPVLPVVDTLKRLVEDHVGETVDRAGLATAQTPQGARREALRRAWQLFPPVGPREFTDEAALLEACGIPVQAVGGELDNLKVTVAGDLARAVDAIEGRVTRRNGPTTRLGLGSDRHGFGPGAPLALGGVTIPGAPRLHGHSDGDVVLHAVADALLGAAGLGDLGTIHPADGRTPRGIASSELLASVVTRLAQAGLRPASVDLTITAGRPRLARYLEPMRTAIAALLGLDEALVNVKASTGNLGGDEGAGRAISALAIARLESIR
jgi:2-C-methyl-D-erythritol 4-phosphate cytidylyltransferase/2-C-methyl-D-erythritol 2,4-cyclodiphosphate synthase